MEDVVSIPQRRKADHEFVQAVVDVLAEPARQHLAREGNIGRGDDPHVHADRVLAAEALHLSFLQRTQELCLCGERKVDDLVEEQAPPLGELEVPHLSLVRTGERALLIAEELRFDQGVGNRAAVHGDKWLLASGTQLMDRPSHEFLAGAGLAVDEDRERRIGHLLDLLDDLLHLPTRAYQPFQRALDDLVCLPQLVRALLDGPLQLVGAALQRSLLLDPAAQLAHLNRPAQRRDEVIPVDRLLDEIVGAPPQRLHGQVVLAMPGDHQGRRVGPARPDLGQQRETVHPRHLDVGDDRVVVPGGDPVERDRRRVSRLHGRLGHSELKSLGKRLEQGRVVVHDEHARLFAPAPELLHDLFQLAGAALQGHLPVLHPPIQCVRSHRARQRRHEVIPVDRLLDEVVGPAAESLNRQRVLAVPGDHQDGRVGPSRPDLGQERQTVHARHLDVDDDRLVLPSGDPVEGGRPRVGGVDRHAVHSEPERFGQRRQQGRVVVDDENVRRRHGSLVSAAARGNCRRKVAPSPGRLTTEIVPPCSLTIP